MKILANNKLGIGIQITLLTMGLVGVTEMILGYNDIFFHWGEDAIWVYIMFPLYIVASFIGVLMCRNI